MDRRQQTASSKASDLSATSGQRLKGHVALVTGSDSGIGQAIAIAYAQEGADVAVCWHTDREGAESTRREVERAGRNAVLVQLDQRDPASVARFFDEAERNLGKVTLLVNDAGIDATGKKVEEMAPEDMENAMRTNFLGPFACCREFLRRFDWDGPNGVILNITSVHQEYPREGASGYDAAKGALRNLTRTLALELGGRGVRVVNIAPGMVLTPFNQKAIDDPDVLERMTSMIPMKRAARPEEIARVAVFLASSEASYVTGTTVFVDGGLGMQQAQGA